MDDSGQFGQHRLNRRFRSGDVEADYLTWYFGIWGRRTRWFVAFATTVVMANLAIVLIGGSTRRKALDFEQSSAALACLVIVPVVGLAACSLLLFLFSQSSLYRAATHQSATAGFIIAACLVDVVPRLVYCEAMEVSETGLCETSEMDAPELASLAASDAASFAYGHCLIMGTILALAGLRPAGYTVVAFVVAGAGHRDQNAMSALCFGDASPMPSFTTRLSALVGAVALSFALNERYRCEFVLQQMVRAVTVERLRQEQEARDWARKLGEKRASSATAMPADAEDRCKPAWPDGSDAASISSSNSHRPRPEGSHGSSSDSSSEANSELAAIDSTAIDSNLRDIPGLRRIILPANMLGKRSRHAPRLGRDTTGAAQRERAGTMVSIKEVESEAKHETQDPSSFSSSHDPATGHHVKEPT